MPSLGAIFSFGLAFLTLENTRVAMNVPLKHKNRCIIIIVSPKILHFFHQKGQITNHHTSSKGST